jgi:molybdopterin molybdotransferase
MAQLSDDCFASDGELMPTETALALLGDRLRAVCEIETVELRAALGRILAEDVAAPISVPPHDNSAVDGYAVYFDDLDAERETRLPVIGRAAAGHPYSGAVNRGTALRIFTGAPMPPGPDTVMMQEDCREEGGAVIIPPGIKRGANRRKAGEDIRADAIVLERGNRLRAQDIGLAASVGRTTVDVYRPLRVTLFSTGDEIRDPGSDLPRGCVYDSNRYTLTALLDGLGCAVVDLGILADDFAAIRDTLAAARDDSDLIITSGGMSVGEEDHVKAAVEALGSLHFWRLAIKPGRPVALGQVGRTPFVGLPGNPVAMMVTFLRIARPVILRLAGSIDLAPHLFKVTAGFDHRKKAKRREWVRVRLEADGTGGWIAAKFPRGGAGILSSMVEADGLIELPEDLTQLKAGTMVDFLPFSEFRL